MTASVLENVHDEHQCVFMCISLHTCEDPHGPVHSVDISADQHLHQQGEELWPGLRPIPVSDGRHSVRNTGTDFADRLPQTTGQQLPNSSFSLEGGEQDFSFNPFEVRVRKDSKKINKSMSGEEWIT